MSAGFFITGTGTDVGKTVVTAGLARFFMKSGRSIVPVKPVQSGAVVLPDGSLDSPDGDVYRAAGAVWDINRQCPYIFEPPTSPHLAARLAGVELDPAKIATKVRECEKDGFLLVEGAGGIMVPLNEDASMLNLMKELGYPVILVVENKLGCINEALLSIAALQQSGLDISGLVMTAPNKPAPEEFGIAEENIRFIEKIAEVKVIASIPYIENWDYNDPKCWEIVDKALDS
ncbi:dethiobiotin synthase [Desulfovibrio sp. JC022]|uniref:dethiobiotin synthase n=1 Tax=Desulfovibrio sp. JC022 TaxID=2593642 RepID=UPI0013D5B076|nr:dethiobiotin synthase [Desulfovibrio sp. JC022]NDV22757.1 dethiobiotin synthase [Desulfovibrio sp. JC022]